MTNHTIPPPLELPHLSSIDEQGNVLMVARASITPIKTDDDDDLMTLLTPINTDDGALMALINPFRKIRNDEFANKMLLTTITTADGLYYRLPPGNLTDWAIRLISLRIFHDITVFPYEVEFGITPDGRPFAEFLHNRQT